MSIEEVSVRESLSARQREWLSHLEAWREQGGTLKAYASAHQLSLSGLYTARRVLEQRGVWTSRASRESRAASLPTLVPVRLTSMPTAPAMFRLLMPSGVVVEVPEHVNPAHCRSVLASVLDALR